MDYLPPVNSSGNILPVPILASNCSSIGGNDWKILQDISGCGGNNSEVLFMLDEAKMHLINAEDPFKAVVPTTSSIPVVDPQGDLLALVKDEEVDPWTEHVNYAVTHNHTYTLRGVSWFLECPLPPLRIFVFLHAFSPFSSQMP